MIVNENCQLTKLVLNMGFLQGLVMLTITVILHWNSNTFRYLLLALWWCTHFLHAPLQYLNHVFKTIEEFTLFVIGSYEFCCCTCNIMDNCKKAYNKNVPPSAKMLIWALRHTSTHKTQRSSSGSSFKGFIKSHESVRRRWTLSPCAIRDNWGIVSTLRTPDDS